LGAGVVKVGEAMSSLTLTDEQLAQKYGRRNLPPGAIIVDEPSELGYRCPKGHTGGDLVFSEFNDHLWCLICQKDYHYADDCHLIRPCWQTKEQFNEFVSGLPMKPKIIKGLLHFPDCDVPSA